MGKFLAGVFLGVFAGALIVEAVRRGKPDMYAKWSLAADTALDGFDTFLRPGKRAAEKSYRPEKIVVQ